MSNNKPTCDDTLANKGVADPRSLWNEHRKLVEAIKRNGGTMKL